MLKRVGYPGVWIVGILLCCLSTRQGEAQVRPVLDPARAITQYVYESWSDHDGLPQNTLLALTQTRDGYLWIGTQEGLVRFDGQQFEVYDKRNAPLQSNYITALQEDRAGNLWIGTRGGGLVQYRDGRFSTYTRKDGLSSNRISALAEDHRGRLWVGTTDAGINLLDQGTIVSYTQADGLSSDRISMLVSDPDGTLWIGTRDAGLICYEEGVFKTHDTARGLPENDISSLEISATGELWIGTRGAGLTLVRDGQYTTFNVEDGLPSNRIVALQEDAVGSLWIGTDRGGLARYREGRFEAFTAAEGLSYDVVTALVQDREGSLWIGTHGGGLGRLRDGLFTAYTAREGLADNITYGVYEDRHGAVWVGTDAGVSRLYDGQITTYTTRDGLASDLVITVYGTRDGSIWLGTYGGGLTRLVDTVEGAFDYRATHYGRKQDIGDHVFALYEDLQGDLWVGTSQGLYCFREGRFERMETGLADDYVTALLGDHAGNLWVGTHEGGLARLHGDTVAATYLDADTLQSNFILSLYEDADHTLWVGLQEGGLYRFAGTQITAYTTKDGLFSDNVLQILEDEGENLWMSSNRGLFRVNKVQLAAFDQGEAEAVVSLHYGRAEGMKSEEFNGGFQPAGWKGADGQLWFPSTYGVVSVDPAYLPINTQPPPVVIERLQVDAEPIALAETVELDPGSDKLVFDYTALSLVVPEKVTFRYRLVERDAAWVEAGTRRQAYYTNLDPGTYTFRVIAANNDGVWNEEGATLTFVLKPYFYQTAWFIFLLIAVVILLVLLIHRFRTAGLRERKQELERVVNIRTHALRLEKDKTDEAMAFIEHQAEELRKLDRFKTQFFASISHEFRTPLTMILGPLENTLQGAYGDIPVPVRRQAEIMRRNALRLMRLINQLLDLSKLEAGRMSLQAGARDLVAFLEDVLLTSTPYAEQNAITLSFVTTRAGMELYFEPDKFEKVFYNLLSNAIKFTPPGGEVHVILRDGAQPGTVEVCVRDTGKGIPADQLPYIFDRFHQVDGANTADHEGTGIGLALVKEMVELHGGTVAVESIPEQGTTFTVTLPIGRAHLEADQLLEAEVGEGLSGSAQRMLMELAWQEPPEEEREQEATAEDKEVPLVLVVDDNRDVREYIGGLLISHFLFRVAYACDGREGLEQARMLKPSLIISDVMMPNMDGNALCRAVKADVSLGYIPVILVSARATHQLKLEGLAGGADDYITKPFNAPELLVRVRNLLTLRFHQNQLFDLNEELKHKNDMLREASELKSQVLRIAAHDMKNPLYVIREFAGILQKEECVDAKEIEEMLFSIHDSADRMLDMIAKLLDASALENGRIRLRKEQIWARSFVETVVQRNRRQAAQKEQQVLFDATSEADWLINVDWGRMEEVLENLISNAIKYSPHGKRIWLGLEGTNERVAVSVRDEGPGLTEQDKEKVFGKFQRLSAKPTGGESSTGLGLSIVKQLIELHAGQVRVESEVGQGSTFFIELPARRKAAADRPAQEPPTTSTSEDRIRKES